VNFRFKDAQGQIHEAIAAVGETLKQVSAMNPLVDLECACGGTLQCTACHIEMDPKLAGSPCEEEMDLLDTVKDALPTSRLGCQVRITPEMENALVFSLISNRRRKVLLGMDQEQLELMLKTYQAPAFRAKQLVDILYSSRGDSLRSLHDLVQWPLSLRQRLENDGVVVGRNEVMRERISVDGTHKFLIEVQDKMIECVGIPSEKRLTVCVSTQVGCAMGCSFCATGKMGLTRNLTVDQILDQVLTVQDRMKTRVSHVVFMGMGEPMGNYDATIAAVKAMNKQIGIGMRNITVSTVGIPGAINKLAEENLQITLAVSLHAATQQQREEMVPSAKEYPLHQLVDDCKNYVAKTNRRVTFEYCLLAGVNDTPEEARALNELMRGWQCHLNIIPWNSIDDTSFKRPTKQQVDRFIEMIGQNVTVRKTRGMDANMACGQLIVNNK